MLRAMPDTATTPTRIAVANEAQHLEITWADGHTSVYSYEGLRRACPCVVCRGGHGQMAEPVDPAVWELPSLQTYAIESIEPAGNYAIQIVWDDGHREGLWTWAFLRSLRPGPGD